MMVSSVVSLFENIKKEVTTNGVSKLPPIQVLTHPTFNYSDRMRTDFFIRRGTPSGPIFLTSKRHKDFSQMFQNYIDDYNLPRD